MSKNVVISEKDFEKMIGRMRRMRNEIEKLKEANKFLNTQIKEYNKEFADEKNK